MKSLKLDLIKINKKEHQLSTDKQNKMFFTLNKMASLHHRKFMGIKWCFVVKPVYVYEAL